MPVTIDGKVYELVSRVAQQLGTTRQTLYNACKRGLIDFVVIGRQRLVDVQQATEFVRNLYRRDIAARMHRAWQRRKKRGAKEVSTDAA
jgi:DNA invertase Pin-like site-specific DNA recombinase